MKYYVGIDIGGTNTDIAVFDENQHNVYRNKIPTNETKQLHAILMDIVRLFDFTLQECNITREQIYWVGVGVPGAVNFQTGVLDYYAGFGGALNYPLRDKLQRLLDCETVFIENDANAAAYGEFLVSENQSDDTYVMVTLGTGIGCGIIQNKQIYHGINNAAGEMGHMMIDIGGKECSCGNRGCFEAYASATALTRMALKLARGPRGQGIMRAAGVPDNIEAKTVFDAVQMGDRGARDILNQYLDYLAIGVTNIIHLLQPKELFIAGGMSVQRDLLIVPLISRVNQLEYTKNTRRRTVIKAASLNKEAGVVGAAFLGSQFHTQEA